MRTSWLVIGLALLVAVTAAGCGGDSSSERGSYVPPEEVYPPPDESDVLPEETYVPPEDETAFEGFSVVVQRRTVGLNPELSMECYEFYSDGSVELFHNGAVTDYGAFSPDTGEISWSSGNVSLVETDGSSYWVNAAKGALVDTCL